MITVFGSINIDLIVAVDTLPRPGETVLGPEYRMLAGGKGANQALAAARAGARVRLIGAVGDDDFAGRALADLRAAAVDLAGVVRRPDPTGAALICVDRHGENMIVVASGANRRVTADQVDEATLATPGLLLLQMETAAAENWRLIERARRRGWDVLLNAAPAGDIPATILRQLDWLAVNDGEAMTIAARAGLAPATPMEAARRLATTAGLRCIVTLGGEGAIAVDGAILWRVGVLPIKPVDTVGAGDAFVGAFAAAIDAGHDLPAALHRASVAAGLACLIPGAQPSLPTREAVEGRLGDLAPPQPMSA